MNKKFLSLAVEAALAAPAAAMAEATIYGTLHMSLDYVDTDANAYWGAPPANNQGRKVGDDFKGWGLGTNARSNRVGLKGSEDLGNGLKAIYQVEFAVGLANEDSDIDNGDSSSIKMRNSYVGLAGGWGTALMGRHDTPLKMSTGKLDLFADTLADYNHTVGFQDIRADSAVAYVSPNWSGFNFAAAVIPSAGATPGLGWNDDADGIADAWSIAATYDNGPFFASAAYERLGDKHWDALTTDPQDFNKYRFGLGLLNYSGFTLAGIYEHWNDAVGIDDNDLDLWQIQAQYAFGNNAVKGMYGGVSSDLRLAELVDRDDENKNTWAIGLDHNFSKRTRAYILYTSMNDDQPDADWNGFSLGMIHKF
jgi:predicted porin